MSAPPVGPRAILVAVDFGRVHFQESLAELRMLTESAGSLPVAHITGKRVRPDPALFIGSGKAEEVQLAIATHAAELVIFNHSLSPAQQRNLERFLNVHVIDRTGLILDIFAQRAQSHVGKIQVELAQVQYQSSRLVRAWSHLERQKGGIGMRGGPGESQMELDRRMLDTRAKRLRLDLDKLRKQQGTQRRARMRRGVFTISLVGYTNAGKSTLFNVLTKANTYAADQLFATLDTTTRRVYLPEQDNVIMSDTVGFIRELPHQLIEAFRATLEETAHADLLLHVVDASSDESAQQIEQVNQVLSEIDALGTPQLLVMNKIDLASELAHSPRIEYDELGRPSRIFISAKDGAGVDALRSVLAQIVSGTVNAPSSDGLACDKILK